MAFYEKHLKDDEQLIRIVRRYWLTFFLSLFASSLLVLIPFFFLIPLFSAGTIGVIGFSIFLFFGSFILARNIAVAYFNSFIVTDRRVIDYDQKGLFDRTVTEATYNRVQDISYRIKGVLSTMMNYGSVVIQTAGTQPNLELKNVKAPQKIQQLIADLQNHYENEREFENKIDDNNNEFDGLNSDELAESLGKIKKALGEEKFNKLIKE